MTTLPDFDELNNIRTTLTEQLAGDGDLSTIPNSLEPQTRKRVEDTIFELITMGYVYGIEVAGLDLETDLPVSAERMYATANKPTAGEDFRKRIDNHIQAFNRGETTPEQLVERLSVVAETETHRAINTGGLDGAQEYADTHRGQTVFKTWVTAGDERVRDTHDYLEGSTIPLNARFFTCDGDSARFPGDFVLPENVVNCRCIIRYTKA